MKPVSARPAYDEEAIQRKKLRRPRAGTHHLRGPLRLIHRSTE